MVPWQNAFTHTTTDTDLTVVLTAPPRGILQTLSIYQSSGAEDGFTVDVYSRDATTLGEDDPDISMFRVIVPTEVISASDNRLELSKLYAPYLNSDPVIVPAHKLYLRLQLIYSNSEESKTFQIGYAILGDIR